MTIVLALCPALQARESKKENSERVTFAVDMYCENCKAKIVKNISWEKGVKDLTVSLEKKTVTIVYHPGKTAEATLKQAIEKLGYSCERADSLLQR
jgi:copper chaperone CopZ